MKSHIWELKTWNSIPNCNSWYFFCLLNFKAAKINFHFFSRIKSQGLLTKFQKELESTNKKVNGEESVKRAIRKDDQNQNSNTDADTNELKKLSEKSSQFNAEIFSQHAEEFSRNYHETELNKKQQTSSLNNLVNANANVSLGSKRKRERKAAFEGIKRVRVEKPEERIRPLLE